MTINRPADELYAFWREPANLVRVMENIRSIEPIDATRSRWTVKALGNEVSWESVITKDVPGEKLHDEQDVYTKIVLKPGQAGGRLAA